MIQGLGISNFKCFKKLQLHDLGRFNVIVGRNGGGKTALLEAIFFLISVGPQLVLTIRRMRGLGDQVTISTERGSFESLWRDLFFDFDETSTIELRAIGTDQNSRALVVSYGPPEGTTLPFGQQSADGTVQEAKIDFKYTKANGEVILAQPTMSKQGLSFGEIVESFPAILLTPVFREGPEHNGKRFSALSIKGEQQQVISVIRKQFPFIEDLSVEYHSDTAMVHAKIRSVHEKVPLPLVSDGVNKMVSILLALHHFSSGVVLIDEMENGLYFDLMEQASDAMLESAKKSNTQLFVTTHSLEYLKALLPVVRAHPDDFRLLRTTKDNGACHIDTFDGHHFAAAVEEGLEIR